MIEQDLGRALRSRGLKQADVTAASRLAGVDKTQAAHLLVELTSPRIGEIIRKARSVNVPVWDHCDWTTTLVDNDPERRRPRMDAAIEVFNHLF